MDPKIRKLLEESLFILELQGCFLRDTLIGDCSVYQAKKCAACELIDKLRKELKV